MNGHKRFYGVFSLFSIWIMVSSQDSFEATILCDVFYVMFEFKNQRSLISTFT